MFGYIRPAENELKVSEYRFYRAAYCGVCRAMKKELGVLAPLSLRYDFVFLALVRMVITGEMPAVSGRRCIVSPVKRRPMLKENRALQYAARCAGLLSHYGVQDNLADEHGVRRMLYRFASPAAAHWRKRALCGESPALHDEDAEIASELARLAALETQREPSPDAAAEPFSVLLGALFSAGLDEEHQRRIAKSCGEQIGRFIYLCDACDDAPEDEKTGAYNPIVLQAKEAGMTADAYLSAKENKERLRCAMQMACANALHALLLADGAEEHPAWPCVENILTHGACAIIGHVLETPGTPLPETGHGTDISWSDPSYLSEKVSEKGTIQND